MPRQKPAADARLAFRLPSAVAESWRRQAEAAGLSLSWMGNNINQIARWVNTNKSGIEAVELLTQLNALSTSFSFLLPRKERSDAQEV